MNIQFIDEFLTKKDCFLRIFVALNELKIDFCKLILNTAF